MNPLRRLFLAIGALGLWTSQLASARETKSDKLPSRITIIVGFPPGGGTDLLARHLAAGLQQKLQIPVIVINRPGAGGQIAAQILKKSKPDGGLLFLSHDHTISILPQINKDSGYDPATDFSPIAGIGRFVNCFVIASNVPAVSYSQYRDWISKQKDVKRTVGIPAAASTPEHFVNRLNQHGQLGVVAIPYHGSAPMLNDILAGHISAAIGSIFECIEYHRSNKIRIVAISGNTRSALLPNVPTFSELGIPGFDRKPFYGIFSTQGISPNIRDVIGLAIKHVINEPKFNELYNSLGVEINWSSPDQFAREVADYTKDWHNIFSEFEEERLL